MASGSGRIARGVLWNGVSERATNERRTAVTRSFGALARSPPACPDVAGEWQLLPSAGDRKAYHAPAAIDRGDRLVFGEKAWQIDNTARHPDG
jgi:hypothetical protein